MTDTPQPPLSVIDNAIVPLQPAERFGIALGRDLRPIVSTILQAAANDKAALAWFVERAIDAGVLEVKGYWDESTKQTFNWVSPNSTIRKWPVYTFNRSADGRS